MFLQVLNVGGGGLHHPHEDTAVAGWNARERRIVGLWDCGIVGLWDCGWCEGYTVGGSRWFRTFAVFRSGKMEY